MKRITITLFIACFLFSNGINYAQDIMVGDPYYFCAMNGSCYNNIPGRLVTCVAADFSPEYAALLTEQFLLMHDGCTIIEPASQLYNCQGYAYSIYQGGPPLQIGWKEELCSYNGTSIESYIQIPFFRICNSEAVRPAFAMRDETKTSSKTQKHNDK